MDQRTVTSDSGNGSSNGHAANTMPNVLFREIHKNAFLKRHSSDRRTGFPRKSERVWVVFCVHDDVEPFLEIYPDQKVALTHKPDWFASLSSALHVSPTICGHEDEFEFAVTLSFQVVRLAAPSWESMMEWVETIRNKLRELKVLCPKENVYSKMPEQKQPLLPTRDPNSPLPLPPEGPSTLLPGVELVHLESRNGSCVNGNGDVGRHQRESHARNNVILERQLAKKRMNEREKRSAGVSENSTSSQLPQVSNSSSSSSSSSTSASEHGNGEQVSHAPLSTIVDFQNNKQRVRRSGPYVQPSTSSQITSNGPNVTVIEVSPSSSSSSGGSSSNSCQENHSISDVNMVKHCEKRGDSIDSGESVDEDALRVSQVPDVTASPGSGPDEEAHYEHVFLSTVPISAECSVKCTDVGPVKAGSKPPHSTSVLINSNTSTAVGSSQSETGAGPSSSTGPSVSISTADVQTGNLTCVNLTRSPGPDRKSDKFETSIPVQAKLEKVNIPGLIPRLPAKSAKAHKSNGLVADVKKSTAESSLVPTQVHVSNGEDPSRVEGTSSNTPPYSQVKKIQKVKVKSDDVRIQEHVAGKSGGSPILPKRTTEIQILEPEAHSSHNRGVHSNRSGISMGNPKVPIKVSPWPKATESKCPGNLVNITTSKEVLQQNGVRNGPTADHRAETVISPLGTRVDNTKISVVKNGNSNSTSLEVEPITASVQPAVGVITVEDIPLIGGHQRRRRRSSSSDAAPVTNVPPSRGIGGADRIRINVPLTEAQRPDVEPRSSGRTCPPDQVVQVNVAPPSSSSSSSRLTLREQQVLQLKKEMLHPGGVRLQLRRKDCTGSIALVDVSNRVWVAGWKQKEHPLLYNALHIGDQLVNVSNVDVRTAAEAQKLIRASTSLYIEFIIRRVPLGNVFALQRSTEGQSLGIVQEGNTAEIRDVVPNGVAARQGLTSKTPCADGLSLTTWFLTEINGRPLNLFFKDNEVRDRLNAVGKEISILVQPHDFIKQIKKQLKNIRGYKDYIVQ